MSLIASYEYDPAQLIEDYLKTRNRELTLNDFLKIETILHPEIADKIEKLPEAKAELLKRSLSNRSHN